MSKERPILFTPENAQKVHDGTKTQTLRLVKVPLWEPLMEMAMAPDCGIWRHADGQTKVRCPYGAVGGLLYVREGHYKPKAGTSECVVFPDGASVTRTAGGTILRGRDEGAGQCLGRALPSIHMPRWACRTVLEITEVRVQRVQDISEQDVHAEGTSQYDGGEYFPKRGPLVSTFMRRWENINGGGSWARNDWVWAITFRRVNP